MVRADVVALLLGDQVGGTVRMAVLAAPRLPGKEDDATATVFVEIDGTSLLADYDRPVLRTDVFVYALSAEREIVAQGAWRYALELGRFRQRLDASGLRLAVPFELSPGTYEVRVLARSEAGTFGLAGAPLEIGMDGGGLLASFVDASDWVPALTSAHGKIPVLPSCRPVLLSGQDHELTVVGPSSGLQGVFEGPDGRTTEVTPAVSGSRLLLPVPALAPGTYVFTAARGAVRSPPMPVIVIPPDTGLPPVWTEIDPSRIPSGTVLPSTDDIEAADLPDRELVAGYLASLRHLGAGERAAALAALYDLETRALASLEIAALKALERAQSETLAMLLHDDPGEWLLPVILLHTDAVRGYREADRLAFVRHAEQTVLRLVRTYAERFPEDEERRDALGVLAALADEQRQRGAVGRAEEIYGLALELDPSNVDASLALAAIYEKLGSYARAAEVLEGLEWASLTSEARLRLGVNLARGRQRDKARRVLERVTQGAGPEWVRLVAFQELARMEMEREAFDVAAEWLRRAERLWPGKISVAVPLAHALDRLGRSREAASLLARVGTASAGSAGVEERYRYNEWPSANVDRERLEERSVARLPDLKRVFEAAAGEVE